MFKPNVYDCVKGIFKPEKPYTLLPEPNCCPSGSNPLKGVHNKKLFPLTEKEALDNFNLDTKLDDKL
jgi:hypothetical protein